MKKTHYSLDWGSEFDLQTGKCFEADGRAQEKMKRMEIVVDDEELRETGTVLDSPVARLSYFPC